MINDVQRAGFTVGIKDTMIAASAKHHGLTVVTRLFIKEGEKIKISTENGGYLGRA